ncbi:MAG: hypothetical protein ACREMG_01345 [Gemmatimonadales bacterium]
MLAPTAGEPQDGFTTQPDRAERSGRPYLQGRARARWGTGGWVGFELRAEGFTGQALAGLGGGGIGQSMVRDGVPVRTSGGWVQLNLGPSIAWEVGAGFGLDDPDDADLNPESRRRNLAFSGHLHWRRAPAVLGLEVREIRTRYATPVGTLGATHVNLAAGFEF